LPGPYWPPFFQAEITPATAGFPGLALLENNFREWYSWAVIASVVSGAGLICHVPSIDSNQTDIRVETVGMYAGKQRTIRIQAKASSNLGSARVGGVDYVTKSFERDYYDKLQIPATNPLFLVLVALPPLAAPWTRVRASIHALHAAAWWGSVTDPPNGKATQTVRIPATQRLDVPGLHAMIQSA
jgi:hypothetical protein